MLTPGESPPTLLKRTEILGAIMTAIRCGLIPSLSGMAGSAYNHTDNQMKWTWYGKHTFFTHRHMSEKGRSYQILPMAHQKMVLPTN